MTDMDMQPSPELNIYVHRALFGEITRPALVPWYSNSWEGMRLVVEEMIKRGAETNIGYYDQWDCSFDYRGTNYRAVADTAPHAVTLAALKALEETE